MNVLFVKVFCEWSLWSKLWLVNDVFNVTIYIQLMYYNYHVTSFYFLFRDLFLVCYVSFGWLPRFVGEPDVLTLHVIALIGCDTGLRLGYFMLLFCLDSCLGPFWCFHAFIPFVLLLDDHILSWLVFTLWFLVSQLTHVMHSILLWVFNITIMWCWSSIRVNWVRIIITIMCFWQILVIQYI